MNEPNVSEFANAIGIDCDVLTNIIDRWSCDDGIGLSTRIKTLVQIKLMYVDRCIIKKYTIEKFVKYLQSKSTAYEYVDEEEFDT